MSTVCNRSFTHATNAYWYVICYIPNSLKLVTSMTRNPQPETSVAHQDDAATLRLQDVVAALPFTLEILPTSIHPNKVVSSVEIHEESLRGAPRAGAAVLAVGIDSVQAPALIARYAGTASALVLAHHCTLAETAVDDAATRGTAILRLTPGVSWRTVTHQITTLLKAGRRPVSSTDEFDQIPDGDLFELANVLCRLIDAPVTIEDRNTNVLAFSVRQDEADYVRVASILQRTRPHDYVETSMDAVLQSTDPIFVPAAPTVDDRVIMPRMAVAIRDGEHLLGSIWAVVQAPLSSQRVRVLSDAARVATHHMRTSASQRDSSVVEELMSAVLDGGVSAVEAAARLEITTPAVVISVELGEVTTPASASELTGYLSRVAWRARIRSALSLHLRGISTQSLTASLANRVYAIVPLDGRDPAHITSACQSFVERIGTNPPLYVGLGRAAAAVEDLSRSREDADSAAHALHTLADGRHVAAAADILVDSLLVDLRELADRGSRGPTGPFARLLEYDQLRSAHLVETLRAWLDAFGDVTAASNGCGVHSNTFRYRLMRIGEVGEVDLNDADQRFALAFQLRLFGPDANLSSVDVGSGIKALQLTHPSQ